ncbi:MAG: aldolase [Rhodospirillales bacterium 70-18]|nr:class II aldolase/adducin family protein [Rhodospirillales bacterium]OJY65649.1 MAG: aldolase [Rhodospirillales bacterium 70-18]
MSAVIQARSSSAAETEEWRLRCEMAAVFRVSARLGWNEQIGNHNSLMLPQARPDDKPTFLINPRGWRFEELTASSLIVCDLDGKVLRGTGELRKVAFHIHARIHLRNPAATCVMHVHPQYLTALSLLQNPELALAHHNNLILNDRVVIDTMGDAPVDDNSEGDRIADLMGNRTIMIMASHGVTVVGATVAEAFDELHQAERTAMYQVTAMSTGQPLRRLPERLRRRYNGPWGDKVDAAMHLASWRRILDKEGSDYAN